jgi:hypothetical protein
MSSPEKTARRRLEVLLREIGGIIGCCQRDRIMLDVLTLARRRRGHANKAGERILPQRLSNIAFDRANSLQSNEADLLWCLSGIQWCLETLGEEESLAILETTCGPLPASRGAARRRPCPSR